MTDSVDLIVCVRCCHIPEYTIILVLVISIIQYLHVHITQATCTP